MKRQIGVSDFKYVGKPPSHRSSDTVHACALSVCKRIVIGVLWAISELMMHFNGLNMVDVQKVHQSLTGGPKWEPLCLTVHVFKAPEPICTILADFNVVSV